MERPSTREPAQSTIAKAVQRTLRPQPGPQEVFLSTDADIAIFGGAAYAGKTFALLMECARNVDIPNFRAIIFRRTLAQATNPGALWDDACMLYGSFGAEPKVGSLEHTFPVSRASVQLAGMEHEKDRFAWDGAQIPLICFDQLEHFTALQFWYMLSRNRDPLGQIDPYIRATCNPDPDSWLLAVIGWWIDPVTGYPIKERAGKIRWFIKAQDDTLIWGDSREELLREHGNPRLPADHPDQVRPLSITFIPGTIDDNPIGNQKDPLYRAKLRNLNAVERGRLLGGNWKIRAAAGLLFRREWVEVVDAPQGELEAVVRAWDLAGTPKTGTNNPAWTVGIKVGRYKQMREGERKRWIVLHAVRHQWSPARVETLVRTTAEDDGPSTRVRGPQDPGQAGKDQAQRYVAMLAGYDARFRSETGDKITRFNPVSAQCEKGNVEFLRGDWNDEVFRSLEGFPDGIKDDADAFSAAFDELLQFAGAVSMQDDDVAESGVVDRSTGAAAWDY